MVYHKASLVATRDFWRLLTRDRIPLDRLGHSFSRMDEMESKAEATYKIVLDRYPSNAKLLRSYAKFLESIKVRTLSATAIASHCQFATALHTPSSRVHRLLSDTKNNTARSVCRNAGCRMTPGVQPATLLRLKSRRSWRKARQQTSRCATDRHASST